MATHSSILAWRIPWTEEPGGLQPMGSQESDMTWRLNNHHHRQPGVCWPQFFFLSLFGSSLSHARSSFIHAASLLLCTDSLSLSLLLWGRRFSSCSQQALLL